MLKTALQPRWLALLAVVVAVCALFAYLGSWQLGVARDRGAEDAQRAARAQPSVPVEQILQPQQGFPAAAVGRRVTVRGVYDASRQVLVGPRLQQARSGWWVVTALRADSGAWLPVVRGWVASPDDVSALLSAVPTGAASLTGTLQPDDPPADGSERPDGQLAQLDAADLVNRWGSPIYNGYLVLAGERATAAVAQPERVPPPAVVSQGIQWRNAAYAGQWWVFAGFVVVLWWKMVRQDQLDRSRDVERLP